MCVCVCVGIVLCNLPVVIPGYLALPMLMAQRGVDGLASHTAPCSSGINELNTSAFKTKKSSVSRDFCHAKNKTRIACWNVRSLGILSDQSVHLQNVIQTMKSKKIELLALSESRWPEHGITKIRSTTILHSGTSSNHIHGVAISLSPRAHSSWEAAGSIFQPISERIIKIRLKTHLAYATIIAVYAPINPVSANAEANVQSDSFYEQLQACLADVSPKDMIIILGDFNARVGSDFNSWKSVIGPHGLGEMNGNGTRLLDFCASNQLLITNTWFQHKPLHQATWYRNGDRTKQGHMIDYVLVNNRFRTSVLDTRVFRSVYHQSDHELVVSSLRFKIKAKRCHPRVPIRQCTDLPSSIKSIFLSTLSGTFGNVDLQDDVDSVWYAFKSAIHEANKTLPILPRRSDGDWVTDELRNLSRKKRDLWLRLRSDQSESLKYEYQQLRRLSKIAAEKARNAWWSARAVEAEKRAWTSEQLGRGGSLIKELRLLKRHFSKPSTTTLTAKDGTNLTSVDDKLKCWVDHFEGVMSCEVNVNNATLESLPVIESCIPESSTVLDDEGLCCNLSEDEIAVAIKQLKKGKAPGLDEISLEMLRLGGEESIRWLKLVSDVIWREESVPADWRSQLLVPLHKKGSRTNCDNYRGIALLSIPSKVFAKAILNRLKPRAELVLRESQCGFRRNRSCIDQIFSLRVLMEKAREFHHPLYICFVDLRKAYDSVCRSSLWTILQHTYNLPSKLVSIIHALHQGSMAAVRAYGKTSEHFAVTRGVRQGCVLAPTLFNLYFDLVIHLALDVHHNQGRGIKVAYLHGANLVGNRRKLCDEVIVSDLEYADDMAILADSWEDLTAMMGSLAVRCKEFGLSISCQKTKTMAVLPSDLFQPAVPLSLTDGDVPVEVVSNFQYLGNIVQDDCGSTSEVDARICKASKAFASLNRILWYQRKIKTHTKLRILNSVIIPTLLYGLECVVLLESQVQRLQGFVMRCLRIILRVSLWDRKRNTTIRKLAKQQRILSMFTQRRLRLLGHLARMDDGRLPKQLLVCAPVDGRRAVGGQKCRWNDLVTRDLKKCGLTEDWRDLAQDRNAWRGIVKDSVESLNANDEEREKNSKDTRKRVREQRLTSAESALACDHPNCSFKALNIAGLTNHKRQKHSTPQMSPCCFCGQSFHQQGLHNHERFCKSRPPAPD